MDGDYATEIEVASTMLVEAIVEREPDLAHKVLRLDLLVKLLVKDLALQIVQGVWRVLAADVVQEAQRRGLRIERSPWISVLTVFGIVQLQSPYLRDRNTKESARPVKNVLGLRGRGKTPAVERALTDFGAEESFAKASERFEEHYGVTVGRTSVLRVVHKQAHRAERFVADQLEHGEVEEPVATMLAELDGSMLRTGTLEPASGSGLTEVRELPKKRRPDVWREVRVGLVRPLESARATYVAKMADYEQVTQEMAAAARLRGLNSDTEVVKLADGANGLRESLDRNLPDGPFILDQPHFKQHLHEMAEAIGLTGRDRHAAVSDWLDSAFDGQITGLLDSWAQYRGPGHERVLRLVKHMRRFEDAVHYKAFRDRGFPIGSGEVESAHRIPQARMKLPGACWHPDTINPMLALRTVRANRWWDDLWRDAA